MWKTEMDEVKRRKKWWYRCPLPKKKQRVDAKPERNGKCHVYSEEEIMLYKMKMFGREVGTNDS